MKKTAVHLLLSAFLILAVSCKKPAPSSPAAQDTNTPLTTVTDTPTATVTPTVTITSTATPDISISASIDGRTASPAYQVLLHINNSAYQYATVTVNTEGLGYDPLFQSYRSAPSVAPYSPGAVYTITIKTIYGIYSGSVTAPGGNVAVIGGAISYDHEGANDCLEVSNYSSVQTYASLDHTQDINSGFVIPDAAFPAPGGYLLYIYNRSRLSNMFTGPSVPSQSDLEIITLYATTVTKP